MTWLIVQVQSMPKKKLSYRDQPTLGVVCDIKKRQHNDVIKGIGVVYIKNDI